MHTFNRIAYFCSKSILPPIHTIKNFTEIIVSLCISFQPGSFDYKFSLSHTPTDAKREWREINNGKCLPALNYILCREIGITDGSSGDNSGGIGVERGTYGCSWMCCGKERMLVMKTEETWMAVWTRALYNFLLI